MSATGHRNAVVELLGSPDRTEGSLNSPVELKENGFTYNEKWVYTHLTNDPAGVPMRTIYWHRYDFTGTTVRATKDEPWRADDKLLEALKGIPDRLAPIKRDDNQPVAPSGLYRPVSRFKGKPDLGGYIEEDD